MVALARAILYMVAQFWVQHPWVRWAPMASCGHRTLASRLHWSPRATCTNWVPGDAIRGNPGNDARLDTRDLVNQCYSRVSPLLPTCEIANPPRWHCPNYYINATLPTRKWVVNLNFIVKSPADVITSTYSSILKPQVRK